MRPFAERRAARIARLEERAAGKTDEANAAFRRTDQIASMIPMGQPILVGHHSERRHRRDLDRIDQGMRRGFEATKASNELARRAEAAASNTAISSDDPEAIDKLRAKLADLERSRAREKEINAAIRTAKRSAAKDGRPWQELAIVGLTDMGVSESLARMLVEPDFCGRVGIADYQIKNSSADARRIAARIAVLERSAVRAATRAPEQYGDVKIEESENRVRIYFPDKPSEAVRTLLKSRGFRWSPSESAWQRMASDSAWWSAREIVKGLPT